MTKMLQAQVLLAILKNAPMGSAEPRFADYAAAGDVEGFWKYYQNAMAKRSDVRRNVESAGQISFEMLRPAMEPVYRLGTHD
jgi:hypothetical protein